MPDVKKDGDDKEGTEDHDADVRDQVLHTINRKLRTMEDKIRIIQSTFQVLLTMKQLSTC